MNKKVFIIIGIVEIIVVVAIVIFINKNYKMVPISAINAETSTIDIGGETFVKAADHNKENSDSYTSGYNDGKASASSGLKKVRSLVVNMSFVMSGSSNWSSSTPATITINYDANGNAISASISGGAIGNGNGSPYSYGPYDRGFMGLSSYNIQ